MIQKKPELIKSNSINDNKAFNTTGLLKRFYLQPVNGPIYVSFTLIHVHYLYHNHIIENLTKIKIQQDSIESIFKIQNQ